MCEAVISHHRACKSETNVFSNAVYERDINERSIKRTIRFTVALKNCLVYVLFYLVLEKEHHYDAQSKNRPNLMINSSLVSWCSENTMLKLKVLS